MIMAEEINSISVLKSGLQKFEAYIVSSTENIRYLTDFSLDDGYLIITDKKAYLFADGRYIEAAENEAKNCDEVVLLKKASEQLNEILKNAGVSRVYTEGEKLSVADFQSLKKWLECEIKSEKTDDEIKALRRVKSQEEKSRIITAQRIAERAFEHILTFIREGVTENEIRLELEYFMLKNGAEDLSFKTIAISGKNTSMPHGVPTDKKVEKGDFVTMDYGAMVKGYHSDMTRTVAVGFVREKQIEVYNTVLAAQQACYEAVKAGISCKDADAAARQVIEEAGYGQFFTHSTGHGVGIDIHEAPNLSPRSELILKAGDVVTDEPGIYIPGVFGVRIEDMLYVTEDGCENLTKAEKSLIVL